MLRQLLYELIKASGAIFVAALVTLAQHLFNIDDIDTSLFIIYSILIMIYFDVNRGNKKGNEQRLGRKQKEHVRHHRRK